MMAEAAAPLIAHVIHSLDFGGLENGLVNLINHLPRRAFRHAIICLTRAGDFRHRIERADVPVIEIHKRDGKDPAHYARLWRALRELRPEILHTRNLATLECQWLGWAARIPNRIHGEHGWDMQDLEGTRRKHRLLRRTTAPLVDCFVAMSADLERWLIDTIGLERSRVRQIYNGVDTTRFAPRAGRPVDWPFTDPACISVGTVGRMSPVKDQLTLARAFIHCLATRPELRQRLRLVMVGDGPLRREAQDLLVSRGVEQLAWLPGARDDVPALLAAMDLFVLPSRNEGISNTILEAMASGLPVIATDVGGNGELVENSVTGRLVPPQSPVAIADAIADYAALDALRVAHGIAGRKRVEGRFSLERMVRDYFDLYEGVLRRRSGAHALGRAGES